MKEKRLHKSQNIHKFYSDRKIREAQQNSKSFFVFMREKKTCKIFIIIQSIAMKHRALVKVFATFVMVAIVWRPLGWFDWDCVRNTLCCLHVGQCKSAKSILLQVCCVHILFLSVFSYALFCPFCLCHFLSRHMGKKKTMEIKCMLYAKFGQHSEPHRVRNHFFDCAHLNTWAVSINLSCNHLFSTVGLFSC